MEHGFQRVRETAQGKFRKKVIVRLEIERQEKAAQGFQGEEIKIEEGEEIVQVSDGTDVSGDG